ncbi:MAG: bifunctional hydroxymethylpyrimidine kinase/phosphomethylpyrimidine kinase [Armatimonadota bacterium]
MALLAIGANDCSGLTGLTQYCRVGARLGVHVSPIAACLIATGIRSDEVHGVVAVPPSMIAKQIDVCADRANPSAQACVIGMLARHQAVDKVIERIKRREIVRVVFHPVFGVSGTRPLMTGPGVKLARKFLTPLCEMIVGSPANIGELAGMPVHNAREIDRAVAELIVIGAKNVLVLGVPLQSGREDVYYGNGQKRYEHADGATLARGECDTMAAAVAAKLMSGINADDAVDEVQRERRHIVGGSV